MPNYRYYCKGFVKDNLQCILSYFIIEPPIKQANKQPTHTPADPRGFLCHRNKIAT